MAKSKFEREIARTLTRWKARLFLSGWAISVKHMKEDLEGEDEGTLATVSVTAPYDKATIRIYPAFYTCKAVAREQALVHELVHCHTFEMRDLFRRLWQDRLVTAREADDAHERLTERMAKALCGVGGKR